MAPLSNYRNWAIFPKERSGTFNITREAGKMEMTGKFEGDTGMGTYKFIADKAYVDYHEQRTERKTG